MMSIQIQSWPPPRQEFFEAVEAVTRAVIYTPRQFIPGPGSEEKEIRDALNRALPVDTPPEVRNFVNENIVPELAQLNRLINNNHDYQQLLRVIDLSGYYTVKGPSFDGSFSGDVDFFLSN